MSNLYHSYFDTVSTDRQSISPAKKQQQPRQQPPAQPPKKLSKAFTRQLAKTLSTPKKPLKKKKTGTKRRRTHPTKMPKRAAAESYDSDGGFVKDVPRSKKSKGGGSGSSGKAERGEVPQKENDPKGEGVYWSIASKRRLQLSEYRGTTMVGVREYYEKDGEMLPGKKGISMTLEQFNTVVELLPQLESELKAKGVKLARPKYGQTAGAELEDDDQVEGGEEEGQTAAADNGDDEEEVDEEPVPKKTKSKLDKFKHKAQNHEATSDEDEG